MAVASGALVADGGRVVIDGEQTSGNTEPAHATVFAKRKRSPTASRCFAMASTGTGNVSVGVPFLIQRISHAQLISMPSKVLIASALVATASVVARTTASGANSLRDNGAFRYARRVRPEKGDTGCEHRGSSTTSPNVDGSSANNLRFGNTLLYAHS
ncbi:hypothetical protein [Paraburkholderia xenovorans]|uniref:hypothetical protein n=1 Tax=Paraburkholderia xenovorans TaxID=36873 RepID=UPI0038BCA4E9